MKNTQLFHRNCAVCFALIVVCLMTSTSQALAKAGFHEQRIHGWRVNVSDQLKENDPELYTRIMQQITDDLSAVVDVVPRNALRELREVPIWVKHSMKKPFNRLFFNGSKRGSAEHGISHLYGAVVIGNAKGYLGFHPIHPWQMLHELAHAYHQFDIRHDFAPVRQAYDSAIASSLHKFGSEYSRRNFREYFATLTEAYFGTKPIYPHNRKELAAHDPKGYCAVVRAWGLLGRQAADAPLTCVR